MSDYADWTRRLGDRIESGLRRAQDVQVDAIERLRRSLGSRLPALPERLSRRLPQPGAIARANFRLAARVLKAQEAYTLGLIEAVSGPSRRRAPRKSAPSAAVS